MPHKLKTRCQYPGCPELVKGHSFCDQHRMHAYRRQDERRGTPAQCGYDQDWARVAELRRELDAHLIQEIALDRWNATQLATQLDGDGFTVVPFGQGYASMNSPTKKLDEIVRSGKLAHGGHPVLRWMAGNISLETDAADNWKPSKKKSIERIDGIVALIMGIDRATRYTGEPHFWVFEAGTLQL